MTHTQHRLDREGNINLTGVHEAGPVSGPETEIGIVVHEAAYATYATSGAKWGEPEHGTTGGTVTWAMEPGFDEALSFDAEDAIGDAFDSWAAAAVLEFAEVEDPNAAQITFSLAPEDGTAGVLATAATSWYLDGPMIGSDISFDSADNWSLSGAGYDFRAVALHEIGHALGLAHEPVNPAVMNAAYNPDHMELTPDDIAGIQALYGQPEQQLPPMASAEWVV